MNRKLLSLLVTLVAMFGCLGSVRAQEIGTWEGQTVSAGNYYIRNNKTHTFIRNNSTELSIYPGAAGMFTLEKDGSKYKFKNENGKYLTWNATVGSAGNLKTNENSGYAMTFQTSDGGRTYRFYYDGAFGNPYLYLDGQLETSKLTKGTGDGKNSEQAYWQLIPESQYEQNAKNDTDADASGKIMNANGNYKPKYGWNVIGSVNGLYGNSNTGKDGKVGIIEVADWNSSSFNCELSQTVTGLENGCYKLTVDCQASTDATLKIFAGSNEVITISKNEGWETYEVIAEVTDGTLAIGARASANTIHQWTNVDNFKLIKLPAPEVTLNSVETAWIMTGTWLASDMEMLNTTISANPKLLLNASGATLVGKPTIPVPTAVPNMMIKVANAGDVANTQNVIANGECANFVLTDKKDFAPLENFTAKKISYTRTNTAGYNTVCMPFALKASDLAGTCTAYSFVNKEEGIINFKDKGADELISAGTPILVEDTGSEWTVNISENRNVVANAGSEGIVEGAFIKRTLGEGFYKLNSAGTEFVHSTSSSTITPFRFFVEVPASGVKSFVVKFVKASEETAIKGLQKETATDGVVYDLMGRKVAGAVRPGIYIKGGKKVMIK